MTNPGGWDGSPSANDLPVPAYPAPAPAPAFPPPAPAGLAATILPGGKDVAPLRRPIKPARRPATSVAQAWAPPAAIAPAGPAADRFAPPGDTTVAQQQWVPADQQPCSVCGAGPARPTKVVSNRGLLILFTVRTQRAQLCRDCGEARFRDAQNSSLLWGWWGFFSFFITLIVLAVNVSERGKILALPAPRNRQAAPLDPGAPLMNRPGILVGGAVMLFALVAVLAH